MLKQLENISVFSAWTFKKYLFYEHVQTPTGGTNDIRGNTSKFPPKIREKPLESIFTWTDFTDNLVPFTKIKDNVGGEMILRARGRGLKQLFSSYSVNEAECGISLSISCSTPSLNWKWTGVGGWSLVYYFVGSTIIS